MHLAFGFSDHRITRSRAITRLSISPSALPESHRLFNPALPVAKLGA